MTRNAKTSSRKDSAQFSEKGKIKNVDKFHRKEMYQFYLKNRTRALDTRVSLMVIFFIYHGNHML